MMTQKILGSFFTYLQNKQNVVDLVAALLVFSLPISIALPNILLILLTLAVINNHYKFKFSFPLPELIFTGLILYLFLLFLFEFSENEVSIYSRYFASISLMILFLQTENRQLIKCFFLAGLTVAVVGSYLTIYFYKLSHPDFILDIGNEINELLWMERPYFGFMSALGVLISLQYLRAVKNRILFFVLIVLFTSFSIYISARLGILLSVFAILLFFIRSREIKLWAKLSISGLFVIAILISLSLNKGLMSRMHLSAEVDNRMASIMDYEPRFVIWPCAIKSISEDISWFSGSKNYEEITLRLSNCYSDSIQKLDKREYYLKEKFNTHNQFLDFFLIGGVLPFLVLISIFIYVWFSKKYSFETKLIFIFFFSFFFFENVLYRQLGCYLFGVFAAIYLNKNKLEKN